MMEEIIHDLPIDHLSMISNPIGAEIFEFSDSDFLPKVIQNTESSQTSYDPTKHTTQDDFSIIFSNHDKPIEQNTIDFSPSQISASHDQYYNNNTNDITTTTNREPFNISSLNNHLDPNILSWPLHPYAQNQMTVPPPLGPTLPSLPPYISFRSSQSTCSPFLAPSASFSVDSSRIFNEDLMLENDIENGGLFHNYSRVFNSSGELNTPSSESPHLVHGGTFTTSIASEISVFDDPTFKVGKLSVEERKRKIHRYLQKRNERNFSKKIKYACRKTLADSRPRVRGRFAKNDELGEIGRSTGSNQEDEMDDDVGLFSSPIHDQQIKAVKEEEELESDDIFAHISGVNSLKCSYPIQSWI